jgi:antitoxin HicB
MYPNYKKSVFPYANKDGSITWVVEYPDLPGCSAVGKTEEESLQESKIACELWLAEYYDDHGCYPVPKEVNNSYSGKFVLRLPKTLHKELAIQAEEEHVSLNSLILTLLAQKHDSMHIN